MILRKAKPPKNNINKHEFDALGSLNKDLDIVVLKYDKFGVVVILNKEDYRRKILDHLCNNGSYMNLNKNPLKRISRKISLAIKSSIIFGSFSHKLIKSSPITPTIYGLPKIHKEGATLRRIVNTIGGPTYLLAKYLAQNLKPLFGLESFSKDLSSFFNELKGINFGPEYILVIFGIVSLYTNIPINKAIGVVNRKIDPDMAKLFEICLTCTFFNFEGEFYKQTCDVSMGSPLSI